MFQPLVAWTGLSEMRCGVSQGFSLARWILQGGGKFVVPAVTLGTWTLYGRLSQHEMGGQGGLVSKDCKDCKDCNHGVMQGHLTLLACCLLVRSA